MIKSRTKDIFDEEGLQEFTKNNARKLIAERKFIGIAALNLLAAGILDCQYF